MKMGRSFFCSDCSVLEFDGGSSFGAKSGRLSQLRLRGISEGITREELASTLA
jgi:hypothetical protein